jgi:simple sugar transport system substrate-binding protein
MTDLARRALMQVAAVALAAAALAGCGKKEEPAPAPAPAPAAEAPKPTPLKVAWVYVGPVGDAGWTFAHDLGRKAVEAEFGDTVTTTIVEKVPEGADAERVIRDLAAQGHKLVFTTSFGFMEPTLKVAEEFPDVRFEHATGYKTAPNVAVYDNRFYEDAYLAGLVAGHMTKTKTLGFVASFPIPEVLRNINAFTLGARSVDPAIRTKVVWVNTWFDPPKESDAAQSLINAGADVLLQNTDSTAVLQTAQKNGKFAFGWDSDMSAVAPDAHLASVIVDWGPYYVARVRAVIDGSWSTGRRIWGVKEGQATIVKIADIVPDAARQRIDAVKAGLKDGSFAVFTGPIVDNTGAARLAAGVMADQDWHDKVDFYVDGVEGKVPSGK